MPLPSEPADPSEIAGDAAQMQSILEQFLRPANTPALQVIGCRILARRHRDGTRGTTQYEIRLTDPETGQSSDRLVTGLTLGGPRTRRLWLAARELAPPIASSTAGPALLPFAYVPELDMLLQVFPHDQRLPTLARLVSGPDREVARALLSQFGPGDWALHSWSAETVQYRSDMRAIVRLDVEAEEVASGERAKRQFYAKIYRDAEPAAQSFRVQHELYERIAESDSPLTIARPIAIEESLNTVVTTSVPGTSLEKIIRRGTATENAMKSAARAVAALHRLDVSAPARPIADDVGQLQQAKETLLSVRPDLEMMVVDIVSSVVAGIGSSPSTLIHGDLKPEHLLIDGDSVALIDFDLSAHADPMIDVAHLVAFLGSSHERSRRGAGDAGSAARLFVDEYFTLMPMSWRPRLRLYHAMTSIHKAVGLCRKHGSGGNDVVADVIREGQSYLSEDVSDVLAPSFKRRITRSTSH